MKKISDSKYYSVLVIRAKKESRPTILAEVPSKELAIIYDLSHSTFAVHLISLMARKKSIDSLEENQQLEWRAASVYRKEFCHGSSGLIEPFLYIPMLELSEVSEVNKRRRYEQS